MKAKIFAFFVLMTAVLILMGCASSGTIITQPEAAATAPPRQVSSNLGDYETVMINVITRVPGSELMANEIEGMVITGARQTRKFKRVFGYTDVGDEVSTDLEVKITIVKLRKVSSTSRAILGMWAGRAKLVCDISIVERESGQEIRRFKVVGKSSGGSKYARGTHQALRRGTEKIVEYLRVN